MVALLLLAGPLAAQEERRLQAPADLHRDPDGTPLVSLPAGAPVEAGKADGDWRKVTVEGWIYRPSTSPTRRDGFDLVVTSEEGENLRRAPNGPIVGRAREGTLLERVDARGKWFRVRRDGWVPRKLVQGRAGVLAKMRCGQPAEPLQRPARLITDEPAEATTVMPVTAAAPASATAGPPYTARPAQSTIETATATVASRTAVPVGTLTSPTGGLLS